MMGGGKAGEEEKEEPQKRMDGTDTAQTSPLRLEENKDASLGGGVKRRRNSPESANSEGQ